MHSYFTYCPRNYKDLQTISQESEAGSCYRDIYNITARLRIARLGLVIMRVDLPAIQARTNFNK